MNAPHTKTPQPGELWRIEVWSPEKTFFQNVLIIDENALDAAEYGAEVQLFECLVEGDKKTLPIWMFNNGELLSAHRL